MRKRTLPVFAVLMACWGATTLQEAAAQEWSQWRGPKRDGTVIGARLPNKWPEKFPAPTWSAFVGDGYSSPVVGENRVFIQGRPVEGQETCLAFDARTGKPLWKQMYPSTFQPPDPSAGRGPNSTPTVDKDRVYMLGLGGMFHCLDVKTGGVLWKHDFATEFWGADKDDSGSNAAFPVCGMAASALVSGEQVIVPVGGKKAGAFTAFDRKTGGVLWTALPERSSYSSPLMTTLADTPQLVGFTGLRMTGLDPTTRAVLWEFPFRAGFEQTILTPVLWRNRVIVGGEGRPTVALEISKENGKVAQREVWRSPELRAYMTTPIVMGDYLIGLDHQSQRLMCLDMLTGKKMWESPRLAHYASLVNTGSQILALSEHGDLLVLAADPQVYKVLGQWKVSEAGGTMSYLGVAGSRLYIKDKTHLRCYDFASLVASKR